ncbi:MAG: hypothetical protein DRJ09_07325 [Bacteroidetes bacterium]|nr:MAG: hypothetical protein DRJ09_07325 [Bacteroidota bacterium]
MVLKSKYMFYFLKNLGSFFPVRLLLDYLKFNRLILLSWLLPFLFITGVAGEKFGVQTLFLTPEYMGTVNVVAFMFVGLATGSFIMAFHIASYVVMAHRHPFIVRLSKPFYRYAINNSAIPLAYLLLYLIISATYQARYELQSAGVIVFHLLAFLLGVVVFVYLSFGFFYLVVKIVPRLIRYLRLKIKISNKLNFHLLKYLTDKDADNKIKESPIENDMGVKDGFYLLSFFKIRPIGKYTHFTRQQFKQVFQYQHVNAFSYVTFVLVLVIIRGLIKDVPELIIPAGASFLILLTVLLLTTSLFYIVFGKWTVVVIFSVLFLFGYFSPFNMMKYSNSAYGMDYSKNESVNLFSHGNFRQDSLNTIHILNRWKKKNSSVDGSKSKPKMVIICASGGGLKMAVWTYYALGYADSVLNGKLLNHVGLITGASGGMLGAACLRENYLRYQQGKEQHVFSIDKTNRLSKDILNPVFYTFSMSDWFFRLQTFRYNNKTYFKDRAYIFEETLNRNIGNILDKPLADYRKPVQEAIIPMMILTPAIENVGSRLYISSVGVSYLTKVPEGMQIKNIELRHNYARFQPDSLRYLSAIRMNATFPYVSPDVELPGKPEIYLIDAGLNDNFGFITAYLFVMEFKQWIEKNTSGVILIRLDENTKVDYHYISSPIKSMLRPLGSVFTDWINIQEDNYLPVVGSLEKVLPGKFKMMTFAFGGGDKHVPLSWHLTKYDKRILFNSIHSKENRRNIDILKKELN